MREGSCSNMRLFLLTAVLFVVSSCVSAGVIKDLATNLFKPNKGEDGDEVVVKESSPICGHNIFSTSDQRTISPEFIFITSQASHISSPNQGGDEFEARRNNDDISEVAREYRFHVENVTLEELERHGFNRDAPTTFLMHGFTSGYPLQAWISAIVEAYTIDRENKAKLTMPSSFGHESDDDFDSSRHRPVRQAHRQHVGRQPFRFDQLDGFHQTSGIHQTGDFHNQGSSQLVHHNLFIINWNYASRGILYPRAVANIPKVATFATRFINEKLLREAGMDSRHIQLIGHSLGAHLAGFIGKNTRSKVGRIYGLDPAGPCFGTLAGSLYPSSQRLAPTDAEEVITIQTNSALLGIDKPLGRYSIYVEGGSQQPGCRGSTVIKSITALTWDGDDFDDIACSHSRAPNLLTYRIDQTESQEDCQMVAYECKDWDSFTKGLCGICYDENQRGQDFSNQVGPWKPVDCYRIGLDWQYSRKSDSVFHQNQRPSFGDSSLGSHNSNQNNPFRPTNQGTGFGFGHNNDGLRPAINDQGVFDGQSIPNVNSDFVNRPQDSRPFRRPIVQGDRGSQSHGRDRQSSTARPSRQDDEEDTHSYMDKDNVWRRGHNRSRRAANSTEPKESVRQQDNNQGEEERVEPMKMFLRTTDTQPYCTFHYQLILELNEPFPRNKRPPMSLVMQDTQGRSGNTNREQNTISLDNFGEKYDDRIYTHLITSTKKARRIDHATLIFREGLRDGYRSLKSLHINYMSNRDPAVRRRLSANLCLVHKDTHANHREGQDDQQQQNRFFFEPCDRDQQSDHSSNPRPNEFDQGSSSNFGRESSGQSIGSQNGLHSTRRPSRDNDLHKSTREPWRDQDTDREPSVSGSSHNQDRQPWNQHNNNQGGILDLNNGSDEDYDGNHRRPIGADRRPNNSQGSGRRPSLSSTTNNGRRPWNQRDELESSVGRNPNRGRNPWTNPDGSSSSNNRPWEDQNEPSNGRQPWNDGSGLQGGRRPTSSLFDDNRQPWNNQQDSALGGRDSWNPPRSPRPGMTDLLNQQGGRERWNQGTSPLNSQSGRDRWRNPESSSFNGRDPRLQNSRNPQSGGRQPWDRDPFGSGSRDPWNQNSGFGGGANGNEPFEVYSRSLTNTSSSGNSTMLPTTGNSSAVLTTGNSTTLPKTSA